MKTNLRERLTRYRCFIRPKVHFAPEFSFKGIIHPKMKTTSNLYAFSSFVKDKFTKCSLLCTTKAYSNQLSSFKSVKKEVKVNLLKTYMA